MTTLRTLVDRALANGTHDLADFVRQRTDGTVDADAWAAFLAAYLRQAAHTAEALAAVARGHVLEARVRPFLDHIERYAAEADDAIPDALGAVGLLDDALLVMVSIETLRSLMDQPANDNLVAANAVITALVGDDVDTTVRTLVHDVQQRVVVEALLDLPRLLQAIASSGDAELSMDIPTPLFTFPAERSAATVADTTVPTPTIDGRGRALVGRWEYADIYISGGFSAATYVQRTLAPDGRFSERARSHASSTQTNSDGSWGGVVTADSTASPDERGTWSFDGTTLVLAYDDGSTADLIVTLDGNRYLTVPHGGGLRRLWERIG